MKKIILPIILAFVACGNPDTRHIDYRQIAFTQNELILTQEETIEELATVIQTTLHAYQSDYSTIDSLSLILDSLYTTQQ